MITIILVLAAIFVLLAGAIWLSVRSRSLAYSRIERDQIRIDRRVERREQRLRATQLRQRKAEAKRRLKRRRLNRSRREAPKR